MVGVNDTNASPNAPKNNRKRRRRRPRRSSLIDAVAAMNSLDETSSSNDFMHHARLGASSCSCCSSQCPITISQSDESPLTRNNQPQISQSRPVAAPNPRCDLSSKKYTAKTPSSTCDTCRRHHTQTLATSAGMSLSRMTLLLLYLGISTSTFISTAVASSSMESPIKPSVQGGRIMQQNNIDILQENISDEGEEEVDDENVELFDVDLMNDDILEDILSDFDHSLEISGEEILLSSESDNIPPIQKNPKLKVRSQGSSTTDSNSQFQQDEGHEDESPSQSSSNSGKEKNSVIILSAVDGTLAGISRTSGQVLWKQSRDQATNNDIKSVGSPPIEWNKFLSPLVSTTTKSIPSSSSSDEQPTKLHNHHQWHAVPSIDGTVYLTGGDAANNMDGDGSSGNTLSISTHIRDLVDRAPFVDAHQRFFVGSRRAMVAAVDERTGEILRVIPKWKQVDGDGGDGDELPPSVEGRDVVWIGRLEHTVTVHDLHKGTVDIEFSVAEILSVDEMIHGGDVRGRVTTPSSLINPDEGGDADEEITQEEEEMERLFTDYITEALRHPNFGDRILTLPAPPGDESGDDDKEDIYANARRGRTGSSSISQGSPYLVSTPSGNVAFRDDSDSSTVGWVSFDLLDSPVVYAIEASSGHKIRVNMLDDSFLRPPGSDKGGLPQLLQQQIASIEQSALPNGGTIDDECTNEKPGECRAVGFSAQGSVVGALQNGQIYALPLGERISRPPQFPLGLPQPHSHTAASEVATVNNNAAMGYKQPMNTHHATIGFHEHRHDSSSDVDPGDKQHIHLDNVKNQQESSSCIPSSPLYPGCLIGASLMMGNLMDVDGNLDMASVFASSDLDYDLYLDMLAEGANNRKKNNNSNSPYFQQFVQIMSSWIAPTVALIFVVSFEMGRRERLKALNASGGAEGDMKIAMEESIEALKSNSTSHGGVIQLSDEILGYGGHGTIVYKGVLDKRQVAVKRLLAMYHASADREISLLIESDGHPNVVRYFLKEMRGDFVYLALELCDMSLNDLIVSLSKLRNMRRENFQLSGADDFESATKSLLFQIASGVRHIHSLRIVHRDLKPQNILLALRSTKLKAMVKPEESGSSGSDTEIDDTSHSFCSDTNTILDSFRNQEYVPKISDMGLGKQLTGQSSFGLSTLGTGSVGGGAAGDAGAGAGSVGWQAPEVMAQRWSPELSSSNNNETSESLMEASPLESAGVNHRTSRSVDIFSLGCIFYCTILPGSHPYGEWYEREANIMKNTLPNREDLEFVSPDASDLILSMINRNAKARPTATEVCEHPFFWSLAKRLKFLCELSDRIELCDSSQEKEAENSPPALSIFAIEKGAVDIFGTSWEKKLDPELMEASLSRRTYDPSSVRDCLRMIRNKHHHYDELGAKLKSRIGSSTDGLSSYIATTFPRLLMHCYHFCIDNLAPDDSLAGEYKLPISRHLSFKTIKNNKMAKPVIADLSVLDEAKNSSLLETIPDDDDDDDDVEQEHEILEGEVDTHSLPPELEEEPELPTTKPQDELVEPQVSDAKSEEPSSPRMQELECTKSKNDDLSGIVVWSGSNTSKELKCRGWYRSDDEWEQRLDAKLRKRDSNLTRCADDPKFRTRLCNHWDVNQGTYCPMRKKNKCIFAHGPIELRVKEGKRERWGTLVNKQGLCANPKASGGEDTYGAARSIEKTRKEQGQWSVDSKQKKQGKGKPKGGKQSPKKKKEQS